MRTIRISLSAVLILLISPRYAIPLEWFSWPPSPQIALTFDDGPHPLPTSLLCDVLSRYQVPATFFVVGSVAARHPGVVRELARSGHEILNHTWSHPDVRALSPSALRRELDQTRLLIERITGRNSFLFRTPGATENYLRRFFRIPSGYRLVLWDVHSLDQEGISAQQIADRVLAQAGDGDVVLMHNGLATTRDALDIIVPALQRRGFQFVTVSQLRMRPRSLASSRRPTILQG